MKNDFEIDHAAGHLGDDEIISLLHAKPSSDAEQHLSSCPRCRTELDTYRRTLEALQHWTAPECEVGYEARLWARISGALPRTKRTFWTRVAVPAFGIAAAVVAIALVTLAIRNTPSEQQQSYDPVPPKASDASHRILDVAVKDHFERTSRLLSELEKSTPPERAHLIDISGEQDAASDLLAENRLYRQTAEQQGDRPTADLLENVEQLLVELDHSPSEMPAPQLENLQQRLSDTDVLFKLKVFTSLHPDSNSPQSPVTQL